MLVKGIFFLFLAVASFEGQRAIAGGHGCGPCGGGGVGIGRPIGVGGGAVAFRRANRLGFRSQRAAAFGLFGRSRRLQIRSNLAANRGFRRAGFGLRAAMF